MGEDRTTTPRSGTGGRMLVDALRPHGADTVDLIVAGGARLGEMTTQGYTLLEAPVL